MLFKNRFQAGELLAEKLRAYSSSVVVAIPRGGVPVGFAIATRLKVPLSFVVARKIGAPGQEELGLGALAERNVLVFHEKLLDQLGYSREALQGIIQKEKKELKRRVTLYTGACEQSRRPSLKAKIAIIVDDGLATGYTTRAAILSVAKQKPKAIILAVPVCSSQGVSPLSSLAHIVCLESTDYLTAVGQWYENFEQVSDLEVVKLLKPASDQPASQITEATTSS